MGLPLALSYAANWLAGFHYQLVEFASFIRLPGRICDLNKRAGM